MSTGPRWTVTMDDRPLRHPDAAHQLRARMWEASHPEAVTRVANLLGSDREMAAFMLAGHHGTVDSLCEQLEAALLKLLGEMNEKVKRQTPVDTGALRASTRIRGLVDDQT